jgi:hydroxymethylpyrimidine pyrophosphatase-like HAD family hydrolase
VAGTWHNHGRPLLVSDLDGTLLRRDATLSERTTRVVNDYIAEGGLFTYASGRSFASASRVTAPLNLNLPVITYSGAIVVDPRTGEPREARTLAADAIDEVFHLTRESALVQPILFAIHDGRDRVCWRDDLMTPGVSHYLRGRSWDTRLLPLTTWSTIDLSTVFFISLIGAEQPLRDLHDRLTAARDHCHVALMEDIYAEDQWWLELNSFAGTKAAAAIVIREELGADALVCFGDHHNDLPMFTVADTALAVANAAPAVRAAATEVIGANTVDGVARWISEHAANAV